MITNFNISVDLTNSYNAYVLADFDTSQLSTTNPIKLYIPALMHTIAIGDPKETIVNTKGLSVICNTEGKPLISAPTIKEKNSLDSTIAGNIAEKNMQDAISLVKENVAKWLQVSEGSISGVGGSVSLKYLVKKGTIVRCTFLNGKVSKLSFDISKSDLSALTPTPTIS